MSNNMRNNMPSPALEQKLENMSALKIWFLYGKSHVYLFLREIRYLRRLNETLEKEMADQTREISRLRNIVFAISKDF